MLNRSEYCLGIGDLQLRAKDGFYYLASPYTHDDPKVVEARVEAAHEVFGLLTSYGLHIHNATYETHRVARIFKLPTHFEFWKAHNSAFIRPSAGIIIAEIDGWADSSGVRSEIEEARSLGLPVYGAYRSHPLTLVFREIIRANTPA